VSVQGLLDLPANLSSEQKSKLRADHRRLVQTTYPRSYAALYEGEHRDQLSDGR